MSFQPVPVSRDESRNAVRSACEVATTCQPPSAWGKDPWPATIRDISTGGLSLILDRRFERGSGLAIELPGEDGSTSTVLARVSHVRPCPDGGWFLGCTFISELSEEEVEQVLGQGPVHSASLSEKNGKKQASISGVLFQAWLVGGEVLRWYVRQLDLTAGWPLTPGRVVSLQLGTGEGSQIELTVRSCQKFGSHWVVDGEMADRPLIHPLAHAGAPSLP